MVVNFPLYLAVVALGLQILTWGLDKTEVFEHKSKQIKKIKKVIGLIYVFMGATVVIVAQLYL